MKKNTEPITIVTTRDPSHSRYGLRHLIAGDARFQLLAEVVSSPELLYTVAFHRPRVVLADLHLPGQELIEACRTIRRLYPATGIVALCLSGEGDQVSQAVGAGAAACLLHEEVSTSLLQALHTVAEGRLYGNAVMKSTLQQLYARENDPVASIVDDVISYETIDVGVDETWANMTVDPAGRPWIVYELNINP